MIDFTALFARIDLLCAAVSDELEPGDWRTPRQREQQRLVDELYSYYNSMPEEERKALDDAHAEWHERKEDESERRTLALVDAGTVTVPTSRERYLRRKWAPSPPVTATAVASPHTAPIRTAPRARARRERHVARSTSSSDSGSDSPEGDGEPPSPFPPDPWAQVFQEIHAGGVQLTLFPRTVA